MSTTQTSTIQIRIDNRSKTKVQTILKQLGTDLSSAVKLFIAQVIRTKSIPFVARTVNGYTPEYEQMILDELKSMKAGNEITYKSAKEFLADMNS